MGSKAADSFSLSLFLFLSLRLVRDFVSPLQCTLSPALFKCHREKTKASRALARTPSLLRTVPIPRDNDRN